MHRKTETIAWIILMLSFVACTTLAVGVPLSGRAYVLRSTRSLDVILKKTGNGIVTYQAKGRGAVEVVEENVEVPPRSHITLSSPNAEGLLLFYLPEDPATPVSTLQLHGESDVELISARTPRFNLSQLSHQIHLRVTTSRRLQVAVGGDGRAATLRIQTPQTPPGDFIELEEGAYTLAVDADRTEIVVSRGQALIPDRSGGPLVAVTDSQFTELTMEGRGPIHSGPSRDILRNSDFDQPLTPYWKSFTQRKQIPEESDGTVRLVSNDRASYVVLEREGRGHIEVGISQEINQDIQAIKSLQVNALISVDHQNIPYCGIAGTECPLMIRLYYLDAQGGRHEWVQGFYFYTVPGDDYSDTCPASECEGGAEHIQVLQGTPYRYASPDLLPILKERGTEPTTLLSIDVYASGHAFASVIDEVTVLIEE